MVPRGILKTRCGSRFAMEYVVGFDRRKLENLLGPAPG